MPAQNDKLTNYLSQARRRLRNNDLRRRAGIVAAWGLGTFGLLIILDHLFRLNGWQQWTALASWIAVLAIAVRVSRNRDRNGRKLSDSFVARKLEQSNPALHNTLITALQSKAALPQSESFKQEIERAIAGLTPSKKRFSAFVIIAQLILFTTYAVTAPQSSQVSAKRIAMPWLAIPPPTYTAIVNAWPNHGEQIVTHEPWTIFVDVAGYPAIEGYLFLRSEAGEWERHPLTQQTEGKTRYFCSIPPVSGYWYYRVQIGDATLPQRQVKVVQRPAMLSVKQSLSFPEYLDQPSRRLTQRPIQAVVGTRVSLDFELDREIEAATIEINDTVLKLRTLGRHLKTNKAIPIESSGEWKLNYKLHESEDWITGETAEITAIPDNLPTAEIINPVNDVEIPADSLQEVAYRGTDDFQVVTPELIIRKYGTDDVHQIPCPESALPDRAEGRWSFIPADFDAQPGERFTIAFRVRDGHPAHLPGWSEAIAVTITAPIAPPLPDDAAEPQTPDETVAKNDPKSKPEEEKESITNEQDRSTPPESKSEDETKQNADNKDPEATLPEEVAAAKDNKSTLANPGETNNQEDSEPSQKTDTDSKSADNKNQDQQGQEDQQAAENAPKPSDKDEACKSCNNPKKEGNCKQCDSGKPGGKSGSAQTAESEQKQGSPDKNGEQPGQKPGEPTDKPGEEQVAQEKPAPSDAKSQSKKPGKKTGKSEGQSDRGAEVADEPNQQPGATDPAQAQESQLPPKDPKSTANTEAAAQQQQAATDNGLTPFDAENQTENQADLTTDAAPTRTDPPAGQQIEDDVTEAPEGELETFEADNPNMKRTVGESARQEKPAGKSPGFAPATFSAEDLDLIQSFREAANRLIRKGQKE